MTDAPPPDKATVLSVAGLRCGYGRTEVVHGVDLLVRQGEIACLIVDGPGNGESVRFRDLPLIAETERYATPAYEYLAARGEFALDGKLRPAGILAKPDLEIDHRAASLREIAIGDGRQCRH